MYTACFLLISSYYITDQVEQHVLVLCLSFMFISVDIMLFYLSAAAKEKFCKGFLWPLLVTTLLCSQTTDVAVVSRRCTSFTSQGRVAGKGQLPWSSWYLQLGDRCWRPAYSWRCWQWQPVQQLWQSECRCFVSLASWREGGDGVDESIKLWLCYPVFSKADLVWHLDQVTTPGVSAMLFLFREAVSTHLETPLICKPNLSLYAHAFHHTDTKVHVRDRWM